MRKTERTKEEGGGRERVVVVMVVVEGYLSSVEQPKVEMEAATKLNLGSGLCLDSSLVV